MNIKLSTNTCYKLPLKVLRRLYFSGDAFYSGQGRHQEASFQPNLYDTRRYGHHQRICTIWWVHCIKPWITRWKTGHLSFCYDFRFAGFYVFLPKYLEAQFYVQPNAANVATGVLLTSLWSTYAAFNWSFFSSLFSHCHSPANGMRYFSRMLPLSLLWSQTKAHHADNHGHFLDLFCGFPSTNIFLPRYEKTSGDPRTADVRRQQHSKAFR